MGKYRIMPDFRIAIDARFLARPNSGIGRYTANLVREFALQDSPHQMFLYSDRTFLLPYQLPRHWRVRTGNLRVPALSTFFEQLFFPLWAWRDEVDIFWSPINHLPLLLPSHVRKVVTMHDVVWKRHPETMPFRGRSIEAVLAPKSLKIADQVITVSHFTRREIQAVYPHARCPIDVVYLASSLRSDGPIAPCPITRPYFLFVGSAEPRKNLEGLLRAYLLYRKSSTAPCDLAIVGTYFWGAFDLQTFVNDHQLQSCVHVFRNADDSLLRSLYANTIALVLVSFYEGFGLPLVEAMQWAVPLIASNNSAVAEIAGDAALSVDPYDIASIAQALKTVEVDEESRLQLSIRARLRAEKFSWKRAASESMALIAGASSSESK